MSSTRGPMVTDSDLTGNNCVCTFTYILATCQILGEVIFFLLLTL